MPGNELKEHNIGEILKTVKEVVPECPEARIKKAIADIKTTGIFTLVNTRKFTFYILAKLIQINIYYIHIIMYIYTLVE